MKDTHCQSSGLDLLVCSRGFTVAPGGGSEANFEHCRSFVL